MLLTVHNNVNSNIHTVTTEGYNLMDVCEGSIDTSLFVSTLRNITRIFSRNIDRVTIINELSEIYDVTTHQVLFCSWM